MASDSHYKEATVTNADGLKIFYRVWTPVSAAKAVVLIIHGAGEHGGWYEKTAKELNKHDVIAVAHDHVGHGKSEGARMDLTDFEIYVRDTWQVAGAVVEDTKSEQLPLFFVGHSMGGAIAIETTNSKPEKVRGVVLWGPAIVIDGASPWKVSLGGTVAKLFPNMPIASLSPQYITRDKSIVEQYEKDPLVNHAWLKARFTSVLLTRVLEMHSRLDKITWPFFVLHGQEDKLCSVKGSQQLYDKAASTDKTIKIFPEAYHQVHNELPPIAQETLQLTADWIKSRY